MRGLILFYHLGRNGSGSNLEWRHCRRRARSVRVCRTRRVGLAAVNLTTSLTRATNASDEGDYSFPALPPGEYQVTVQAGPVSASDSYSFGGSRLNH